MATIGQILPALNSGGVERGTLEIAEALIAAGHRAVVISGGGVMVAELEALGATHITLPVGSKKIYTVRSRVVQLAAVIQQEQIELLHFRSRVPAWLSIMTRIYLRRRGYHLLLMSSYHGCYEAANFIKRYYNSAMIRADHTIAVSHWVKSLVQSEYPKFPATHLTVIPRCFDGREFQYQDIDDRARANFRQQNGLHPTAPMLTLVGRLTDFKGVAFMAKALAQLSDLDWQFVSVGEFARYPDEVARVQQTFAAAGISDRVHFLGVRRDMADIYAQTDILLSGSQQPEAFGRAVAEAAACGVPAVVPNVGGNAEVVLDQQTGWHYAFRDHLDAAAVLREVMQLSPEAPLEVWKRAGLNARDHVGKNYPLEKMQQATLMLYDRLLMQAKEAGNNDR